VVALPVALAPPIPGKRPAIRGQVGLLHSLLIQGPAIRTRGTAGGFE
jgi:hypothetical protein